MKVDVIVADQHTGCAGRQESHSKVPVVMMRVADPVKSGLVASLARPGGNITGLSFMPDALGPKGGRTPPRNASKSHTHGLRSTRETIREPSSSSTRSSARASRSDSISCGSRCKPRTIFRPLLRPQSKAKVEALFVMDDGAITKQRQRILELAAKQGLPVVSIYRDFAASGGLISYGPNLDIVYRRAAVYVDKLIKGAPAPSLPVEQPVNFYLAINVKTAKALGLKISDIDIGPRRRGDRVGKYRALEKRGKFKMPTKVNVELIVVWACVGFFTGAGWALATWLVGRILSLNSSIKATGRNVR